MVLRRTLFAIIPTLMLTLSAAATAGEKSVVVELYTSQGCSSCPPADALLGEIASMDGVIAMSLHVDYWDYIGWKDDFADPAYSKRQKLYAHAAGAKSVYTPQMVIGGVDHLIGHKPMELANTIQRHKAVANQVAITAERSGDWVRIAAQSAQNTAMEVHLVGLSSKDVVSIKRGENAGKTITYFNTVREWVTLRDWDGRGKYSARHKLPDGDQTVVIVQKAGHGPIVGAVRVR